MNSQQKYDASPKGRARAARYHKTAASKAHRLALSRTPKGKAGSTARARRRKERNRALVFAHYGLSCRLCGFDNRLALSIDHVNQDGANHKRPNGKRYGGNGLYAWLVGHGFPAGFRTLCMNCQAIEYHTHRLAQRKE